MVVIVVGRLAEHSAEEGAVGESEAGGVSDLRSRTVSQSVSHHTGDSHLVRRCTNSSLLPLHCNGWSVSDEVWGVLQHVHGESHRHLGRVRLVAVCVNTFRSHEEDLPGVLQLAQVLKNIHLLLR